MSETPDMERDVALRALLRQHTPQPPADQVDWDAVHRRITAQAHPLLQRQRMWAAGGAPWLVQVARWSGRALPLSSALAAVLAVILLNVGGSRTDAEAAAAITTAADAPVTNGVAVASADVEFFTVEEELAAGEAMLLAGVDADALLEAALLVEREVVND